MFNLFKEAQAQARSKRMGRKAAAAAAKNAKKSGGATPNDLNNNLNVLINSNNFSIFTGNTGIHNGAKDTETPSSLKVVDAAAAADAPAPSLGGPDRLDTDNMELKSLMKNVVVD